MLKLVFASSNQDKINEASRIVGRTVQWINPKDLDIKTAENIEENGLTFAQNAYIKAFAYLKNSSYPAVGEDTGLCVTALGGKPGLYSNRWFPGTSHDRNLELLRIMEDKADRSAEFVDVICLLDPKLPDSPKYFIGRTQGQITTQLRGMNGFGYDALFLPDGSTLTYAEMTPVEKDRVSHRAKALKLLLKYLTSKP